ncbi:MAG: glycosyl transferase family 2 [Solirubrobacterales bacterium]|nr:glycosyl transferase family 2 [Solirubrobacterales bacterium]
MPRLLFWVPVALLAYAQAGYGVLLAVADRVVPARPPPPGQPELPTVTVIVAAYREEPVIADRVANLRALDYPGERLELVVACDGSPDATAERARAAGADRVLELPRGGKIRAQDAGVRAAAGEIVAFSDANATWAPDALRRLVAPFADREVGYVCGQVRFENPEGGTNQEGVYWRYEMWLRERESRLHSVTGGNGAIYATRREAYVEVDPVMGHDLSFPFNMVKRGWRAVYAPDALAAEKMVPSIEGEFARKRRMMSHAWPIVVDGGLADPTGYPPRYALMIASHRLLRYASPFLHLAALAANVLLLRRARIYVATLALQLGVLAGAALASARPTRIFLLCRYYVLTTASLAAGLWDWRRRGTEAGWDAPEGTR